MDQFTASVRASGAAYEFFDYPGVTGHLFTDKSLPAEYDEKAATLMYERALEFVARTAR